MGEWVVRRGREIRNVRGKCWIGERRVKFKCRRRMTGQGIIFRNGRVRSGTIYFLPIGRRCYYNHVRFILQVSSIEGSESTVVDLKLSGG